MRPAIPGILLYRYYRRRCSRDCVHGGCIESLSQLEALHDFTGVIARSIIDNQYLEIAIGLREYAFERLAQNIGAIIGWNDQQTLALGICEIIWR